MEWVEVVWRNPVRAIRLVQMVVSELSEYARGNLMELINAYDPNRVHWKLVCSYTAGLCEKLNEISECAKRIYWSCVDDYGFDAHCARSAGWEKLEEELRRVVAETFDDIAMLLDEIVEALDALCPNIDRADSP